MQEQTFLQLFEVAKLANFSLAEQDAYEDSLKYYRDLNNVVDTSFSDGRESGMTDLVIRLLKKRFGDLSNETLERINDLTLEAIENLGEALLEFATLDELKEWLDEH